MNSADFNSNSAVPSRGEIAERIAIEASRLGRLAKVNEFPLLAYLLDMAVLEAWREAGECPSGPAAPDESHPANDC